MLNLVNETKNSPDCAPGRQQGDADLFSSWFSCYQGVLPQWQGEQDHRSRNIHAPAPGMFSSLSDAASGVGFWVRWTGARERHLPCSSHLQLYTSTEGRPWQSSRRCLHQMAGVAWQSMHAEGSSMPEAACSTWRQIKPAWFWATTVNMPGQEWHREMQSNRVIAWLLQLVLKKSGWGFHLLRMHREPDL